MSELVAKLPRRTAHAAYALLAAWADISMPLTAAEVCVYDSEAPSVLSTACALREAQRAGLATYTPRWRSDGRLWIATNLAHEYRAALEDRYLADTT
jgi:hypothetical protein